MTWSKLLTLTMLHLVGTMGCGGNVSRSSDEKPFAPEPRGTEPSPDTESSSTVTAENANDVWIFYHHYQGYDSSRLSGDATLVNDCLLVRDVVVLWNPADASAVNALVTSLQAGKRMQVVVGGSGSEPDSRGYPSLETCAGRPVWFAAPGPQIGPSE